MKRSLLVVLFFGCLVSSGSVAQAQIPADPAGITVTGSGIASAAAESARMEIILSDFDAFTGMPSLPEPEATPGAEATGRVAPIVGALDGIDGVDTVHAAFPPVTTPYGPSAVARLSLAVSSPGADLMQQITTTAVQAAAGENLMVVYVGALFGVSDCDSLERAALAAAVADAERQATIQAEVIGATVGEIVTMTADPYSFYAGTPSAGCDAVVPGASYIGDPLLGATLPQFDPTRDAAEVSVYRMLRVTFAMGGAATPAA